MPPRAAHHERASAPAGHHRCHRRARRRAGAAPSWTRSNDAAPACMSGCILAPRLRSEAVFRNAAYTMTPPAPPPRSPTSPPRCLVDFRKHLFVSLMVHGALVAPVAPAEPRLGLVAAMGYA